MAASLPADEDVSYILFNDQRPHLRADLMQIARDLDEIEKQYTIPPKPHPEEFTWFPDLPTEARLKIWGCTMPSGYKGERIVAVKMSCNAVYGGLHLKSKIRLMQPIDRHSRALCYDGLT
jgi:hypothetical protein